MTDTPAAGKIRRFRLESLPARQCPCPISLAKPCRDGPMYACTHRARARRWRQGQKPVQAVLPPRVLLVVAPPRRKELREPEAVQAHILAQERGSIIHVARTDRLTIKRAFLSSNERSHKTPIMEISSTSLYCFISLPGN